MLLYNSIRLKNKADRNLSMRPYWFLLLGIVLLLLFGCANAKKDTNKIKNETISDTKSESLKEREMSEIKECSERPTKKEQEKCYDQFIKEKMHFKTAKQALQEIDDAANKDNSLRLSCHDIVHAIGRETYRKFNNSIPDAFNECVQTCHAGCYHGAIQAFFLGDSYQDDYDPHVTIAQMKEKVKVACKELEDDTKENFQCLHGMGHAIQFYVDNNLTLSLDICDALDTSFQKESCYGGIFMENVVSVNKETRWIRLESPLYPCDGIDSKYRYQCYLMQTSVMIEIFGEDIEKMSDTCKKAGEHVNTCFKSLGRDRSNYIRIKNDAPYEDLKKLDEEYKKDYISGLIYALLDNTWNGYYAFPFCSKLDNELKDYCYRDAISYLNINLGTPKDQIRESCNLHAPEEDKQYCTNRL